MSVMGILKDLTEEISKLKTLKQKRQFIDSLVGLEGDRYKNLNQAFRLIHENETVFLGSTRNNAKIPEVALKKMVDESKPAKEQRVLSKQEHKDLPLREKIFNPDGVRYKDLIGNPNPNPVPKRKQAAPKRKPTAPKPGKEQRVLSKEEFNELPVREQIYNSDGVRIRDLVGKPSIVPKSELAEVVKERANATIEEVIPESPLETPKLNIGTDTSFNIPENIYEILNAKVNKPENVLGLIRDEDLNNRWAEVIQAQNFSHNILGHNLTPTEMLEVASAKEDDNFSNVINKVLSAPKIIAELVSEYGPKVLQWLKDHESDYNTPLPHIGIIPTAQPAQMNLEVEAGPTARQQILANRRMEAEARIGTRQAILEGIRTGPGETARIDILDQVNDPAELHRWNYQIVQTADAMYELKYNEP